MRIVIFGLVFGFASGLASGFAPGLWGPAVFVSSVIAGPLDADFVRGVNHAHIHRGGRGYGSEVGKREHEALRKIGVRWIAITPFGYQAAATAGRIRIGGDRSMTDASLAEEIASAHEKGLRVMIKPHIWSHDFWSGKEWHGTVRQLDDAARESWWRDYHAMILHYAKLAEQTEAEALCIGTELVAMTRHDPQRWRAMIADVRAVYGGKLTYAAHWHEEWQQITFWDVLDTVSVSAYFPLDADDDASVEELVRLWEPWKKKLGDFSEKTGMPIVFAEAGYRAALGTHRKPWEYSGGTYDEDAQAVAYEAMFTALSQEPWWRGVFIWKTFTDPARASRRGDGTDFVFRGRAAERVISHWFE